MDSTYLADALQDRDDVLEVAHVEERELELDVPVVAWALRDLLVARAALLLLV